MGLLSSPETWVNRTTSGAPLGGSPLLSRLVLVIARGSVKVVLDSGRVTSPSDVGAPPGATTQTLRTVVVVLRVVVVVVLSFFTLPSGSVIVDVVVVVLTISVGGEWVMMQADSTPSRQNKKHGLNHIIYWQTSTDILWDNRSFAEVMRSVMAILGHSLLPVVLVSNYA